MNAKELMIGDFVRVSKDVCIKKGTIVKVRSIDGDNSFQEKGLKGCASCETIDDSSITGGVWVEYLEPIPITHEVLEKAGFVKDEDKETGCTYHILVPTGYEKNSFTIQISLYKEPICGVNVLFKCWGWIPPQNGGINDIHLCGMKYVHEMQHAIRLCGIDKELIHF